MPTATYREWPARCACGWSGHIWEWSYNELTCPSCDEEAFYNPDVKFGEAPGISGDELHNYEARHGVCNPDGSPRRFDSKTDLYRALNEAGLKIAGDTPGKPYDVKWSGKVKEAPKAEPIIKNG
jgi:hypothetical protein